MLIVYKGVSFIGGNYLKSHENIIFNPPKGWSDDNLRCIFVNMVQATIEISSIMK
jgi:hypothetical protein